jgi:hypothetical protein
VLAVLFCFTVLVGVGLARRKEAPDSALERARLGERAWENVMQAWARQAESAQGWVRVVADTIGRASGGMAEMAIHDVDPPSAPATLPATIKLRGRGFERGSSVLVGALPATVKSLSDVELVVEAATPSEKGAVAVIVIGPTGKAAHRDQAFTWT